MGPLPSPKRLFAWLALCVLAFACAGCARNKKPTRDLILATTTSTQDSGLLGHILPVFEANKNIRVKVIAVGTGEALALGARGDADVLLVHARSAEDAFMARGHGSLRLDVMHNGFVLVGPSSDPAGARGEPPIAAFRKIASSASPFVSRGDNSGTHSKETEIWRAAGLAATPKPWLVSTGQGMGETARVATEKQAYTLIDRGTWLSMRATLKLEVIGRDDPMLDNPYGVIVVNGREFPQVHEQDATTLARWLVAPETQQRIGQFGKDKYGESLFIPDALAEVKR